MNKKDREREVQKIRRHLERESKKKGSPFKVEVEPIQSIKIGQPLKTIISCMFDDSPCDNFLEIGGTMEPFLRMCSSSSSFDKGEKEVVCPRNKGVPV